MKTKKRLAILMAVVLLLQMMPLPEGSLAGMFGIFSSAEEAPMSGTDKNGITWTLTEDEATDWDSSLGTPYKLTLSGSGDMEKFAIESYKEEGSNYQLKRTTAPWKLSVNQIRTISIGSGITNVSDYAFYGCINVQNVEISEGVKNIGDSAFYQCADVKAIAIPNSVESIGISAFCYCTSVEAIVIPNSVTAIKNYAFQYCTDMTTVTIPDSVTYIGRSAFSHCSKLEEVTVPASVGTIGENVFYFCKQMKKATISEGIKSIGSQAFAYCESLTDISLPVSSLETIGASAFNGTGLTSFTVPASVTSIGKNPFLDTASLSEIKVAEGNSNYKVENNVLIELKDSESYKVVSYPYAGNVNAVVPAKVQVIGESAFQSVPIQSVSLPGSLKEIQTQAFYGANYLTGISIPGNVETIGNSAFNSCYVLKDVSLGGGLITLGASAFYNCTSITEIKLPDKMTTIGNSAFSGCIKLKEMSFPNSMEQVGAGALKGCTSLESASFGSEIQTISGNVFENCPKLANITISQNNTYMTAENNVVYDKQKEKLIYYAAGQAGEKFSIPDSVTKIGNKAFTYCTQLEELRFPISVTALEEYAIYYNSSITKLLFKGDAPSVVEYGSISRDSNDNTKVISCYAQNNSVYGNKVGNGNHDNTGLAVFKTESSSGWENGWTGTKKYKETYEEKYPDVYSWRQNYEVLVWDPGKDDIANGDFDSGLSWEYRDDIGEIKFIGKGEVPDFDIDNLPTWSLVEGVDHMQDIQLVETGGAVKIGNNAFNGAGKLWRILSEDTLKTIGDGTFANCTSLKVVHVSSVKDIGKEAFMGDTAIEGDIDIRGTKTIGEGAFKGCTSMNDILLGESLENVGKEAFASCVSLESFILPESTISLGEGCFSGCSGIRTINIPKGITVIPENLFTGCSNFQKIYFYGDCPSSWADSCFNGTHNNLTIYYRAGNSTWSVVGDEWNGIPVVALDKFYTEKEDHYSFSNSSSSFGYGSKYFIPRQRFVTALQSVIRGSYYYAWDPSWRGSCFGMAASTTEFYEGDQFDVKDYTETAENLYDVLAPGSADADLTKLIEIYQVSQYVDEIGMETSENYGKYRQLIKQVEEFERSGGLSIDSTADPVVLCVYTACSGHALVPVSVNMDGEGNYILEVYDCNYPNRFNTLKIKKDFSGIEYGRYTAASFVKYSTIRDALVNADFTGQSMTKTQKESDKICIAINREEVSLKNDGGRDYTEIKGAYEQIPMSDNEDDEFIGIRSFVLPQKGENKYKIEEAASNKKAGEEEEPLKYYVSTEDLFAEIETSDDDAELTVNSVEDVGNDILTLTSESSDTQTDLTIMDTSGIEKEVSVKGSEVTLKIVDDSEMKVTASEDAEVKVDGKDVDLSEGKEASVSFYASENENPMKVSDLSCELLLDDNKLSGSLEAYLTWAKQEAGDVSITAELKDESGNVIAECKDSKNVSLGMQVINLKLDNVETKFNTLSENLKAACEMTIVDSNGNKVSISLADIVIKVKGQEVITPAPVEPETPAPEEKPSQKPAEAVTSAPTQKPSSDSGLADYPVTVSPTPTALATSTPAATATVAPTTSPTAKPTVTQTPEVTQTPIVTQAPEATQAPVVTQEPTITPEPDNAQDTNSSLPKKGKIKSVGKLKYIVLKSSDSNGKVAVYGSNKKNATKVTIPKKVKINGYSFKVTAINKNAFAGMPKLSQVTIGANVTKIGNGAFKNCKKLKFVIISKNVTTIGNKAFAGCKNLNRMLVKSDKIKSVGSGAFNGVPSDMIVKSSKKKWKEYSKMFVNKGKMSHSALFIIDPVKLEYNNKKY